MMDAKENLNLIAKVYPNIAQELRDRWGTPGFNGYLDDLEQDKTGVRRAGFPQDVLSALFEIGVEHDQLFPQLKPKNDWIS